MSLRNRFHHAIANLTTRHPWLVIIFAVAFSWFAAKKAMGPLSNIDTDILNQLPRERPAVKAYREAVRNYGADHVYAVVRTVNDQPNVPLLVQAANRLATAIDNPEFVFEIQWALDPDTQDHYSAATGITNGLLIPADQWGAIRNQLFRPENLHRIAIRTRHLLNSPLPPRVVDRQLSDPFRLSSTLRRHLLATRSPVTFDTRSGHFLSQRRDMLLMVIRPLKPPTDILFSQELMQMLNRAAEQIERDSSETLPGGVQQPTVDIGYLGPHTETLHDTGLIRQDITSTALASGLCVIALFIIAFRRWSAILFVGVPLVLGIVWTLGLISFIIPQLTIVTCCFAAIVLGLGIDFGIHLYNRFLEDRHEGFPTKHSVRVALLEVGPGIFTGALTTALAFFALLLTEFPGFRELGLIGGTGVLCCLASMYLVMPALIMVLHHHRPRAQHAPLTSFGLESLADAVSRRPRTTMLACLVITFFLGALALARLRFDDDLFHLRDVPREQIALQSHVGNRFTLPGQPLLLTVSVRPDLQRALEANDAIHRRLLELRETYDIAALDSLRTLLPSIGSQRSTSDAIASLNVNAIRAGLTGAGEAVALRDSAFAPGLERLAAWRQETEAAPPLRLSLNSRRSLRRLVPHYVSHRGEDYRVLTSVYPEEKRMPELQLELLMQRLRSMLRQDLRLGPNDPVPLEVTGVSLLVDQLRALIKRDLALMVFVLTFGVLVILWLHFRSWKLALLVTVPALTAVLWTLGIMALIQMPLHFINVLGLPIVIGLGIDNGLHIMERHLHTGHTRIGEAVIKTGRAVVVTSLSTILAFATLSLASFRGIRELGSVVLIGVALSLFTAFTLLPAILWAMGNRQGWRGLLRPDAG